MFSFHTLCAALNKISPAELNPDTFLPLKDIIKPIVKDLLLPFAIQAGLEYNWHTFR